MRTFAAVPAALALLVSACGDLPTSGTPAPDPGAATFQAELRCTVRPGGEGLSCADARGSGGPRAGLIVGGQNVYVRLEATGHAYDAADSTYRIQVGIQNLMAQVFGSPDGASATGVRIFFQVLPEVTQGSGTVAVDSADGTATFLSAGQPYYAYPEALPTGVASEPRTWRFKMGPDVEEFYFGVLVEGDMPHAQSLLLIRPWHDDAFGYVTGLWTAAGGEAFGVGVPGLLLRNPGTGWTEDASPTSEALWDVWGSSATDVFAVGGAGTIVHWDGTTWEEMDAGLGCGCESLNGVWGSGPDDVWAVGDGGLIVHYDGTQWVPGDTMPVEWLGGVWGSGPDDVFAVGDSGAVFHYDGSGWTPMTSGLEDSGEFLNAVWGLSSTDVYAAASNGVLHYDGTGWSLLPGLPPCEHFSVWGTAPDNLFVANECGVEHYDGETWAYMDPGGFVTELWGTGPLNLLANTDGYVYRGTR
jgi:hypothetical protein